MIPSYDIVIVGTGIGGLCTALYLTETELFKKGKLSICLLTKDSLAATNTSWAQGGIAAVHAMEDNFEKHIQETLIAGAFANHTAIVEKVVRSAPSLINDLIKWGTPFDKNENNQFDLAKEGGHSEARIYHYKDQTGFAIQSTLLEAVKQFTNIEVIAYKSLIQAVKPNEHLFCLQLYDTQNKTFSNMCCKQLVLATGGLGMLFKKTTNQHVSSGNGILIAKALGANIENIAYIQFHPTGLFQEGNIAFLISEALRGAGAVLRNESGAAFMAKYDARLDLAPRDIVSRAILQEIESQTLKHVYLDATHIDKVVLNTHFPSIKAACMELLGIDIEKTMIPVVPVQHYSCGGVVVDEYGETSVAHLFAIGELAATGLHGANRLASNSLLEAIAFAKFATDKLIANQLESASNKNEQDYNKDNSYKLSIPTTKNIDRTEIQFLVSKYAGIVKTNDGLEEAMKGLLAIKNKASLDAAFDYEHFEAASMLDVALLIIQDAQQQQTNKGVFYNASLV
jgi:L-aspartate oxidase